MTDENDAQAPQLRSKDRFMQRMNHVGGVRRGLAPGEITSMMHALDGIKTASKSHVKRFKAIKRAPKIDRVQDLIDRVRGSGTVERAKPRRPALGRIMDSPDKTSAEIARDIHQRTQLRQMSQSDQIALMTGGAAGIVRCSKSPTKPVQRSPARASIYRDMSRAASRVSLASLPGMEGIVEMRKAQSSVDKATGLARAFRGKSY